MRSFVSATAVMLDHCLKGGPVQGQWMREAFAADSRAKGRRWRFPSQFNWLLHMNHDWDILLLLVTSLEWIITSSETPSQETEIDREKNYFCG